jgi:hypothetical protein
MNKFTLPFCIILVLMACIPSVNADLTGSPQLSLSLANYDPNPATAGNTVDVSIGILNTGSIATNDLILEVVPVYPFELVQGENAIKDVGIVQGFQADSSGNLKVVKYKMQINRDTPEGTYELKLKYYEQGSTSPTLTSVYIEVKNRVNAEVIQIDKSTIVPGLQSSLKFTINNMGNSPLRDLTFYWENTDNIILPVGSDNTKYIKYIDIGNSSNLEYQVIADTNAQPGLYKINLHLSYQDSLSNQTKTINTIAGIYVGGGTDFDVAFSDNSNGQMSFSVANIGSNPANSVSVMIPDQNSWSLSGPNSVIIGNLNKGDYTVASFKLQSAISNMTAPISQNRAGRNNNNSNSNTQGRSFQRSTNSSPDTLLMQIAYTDTMGVRTVVEKQVNLGSQNSASEAGQTGSRRGATQTASASAIPTYYWYILGIAVVLVGVVGQRKYKSQKLLDPDFKLKDIFKSQKK